MYKTTMWWGVQLPVDWLFKKKGVEVTPKRITFDEANIAYDQILGQGSCEISSIFYGANALVINATQGIFSS